MIRIKTILKKLKIDKIYKIIRVFFEEGYHVLVYKIENGKSVHREALTEYQKWINCNEENILATKPLKYNPYISVCHRLRNTIFSVTICKINQQCISKISVIIDIFNNWRKPSTSTPRHLSFDFGWRSYGYRSVGRFTYKRNTPNSGCSHISN